jgi:Protein of unknown function (DUF3574)
MMQQLRLPAIALAFAGLGAGAVAAYRWTADPGPKCRAGAVAYARLELLFGLGLHGGGEVSEEEWRAFIETEVTPRFPDGLTVLTAFGQWRSRSGEVAKEPSRVLVIWHRRGAGGETDIEAIRQAYKTQFGQESVMWVDGASCVSF